MGNCKTKDVIDAIDISKDIIHKILSVEREEDESKSLLTLLEMLYNIDQLDKHNQKLVLTLVEEKIKKSSNKDALPNQENKEQASL